MFRKGDVTMKNRIKCILARTGTKFISALPTILFFVVLFYSIVLIFGVSHVILVSAVTILFKTNFRKYLTLRQLLFLIGTQFLMAVLSFFASLNLPLCLLLNLTVPFLLVYLQTTQFNPLGYFASASCFVFLQLRPVGFQGLAVQMEALAFGLILAAVSLLLCSIHNKKADSFTLAKKGLKVLAAALRAGCDPESAGYGGLIQEMLPILRELYKEAHKSRGLTNVVSPEGKLQYMFALLLQRGAHFLMNSYQSPLPSGQRLQPGLLLLADYIEQAVAEDFRSEALSEGARKLLNEFKGNEETALLFAQNFLQLFLLILKDFQLLDEKKKAPCWKLPVTRHPIKKFFCRMKTDSFETRFALRLSVVLTICFAYNAAFQANHGYWLALNAFFLLRPMYEDSAYRMKARFIGTVAGCLLLQLLLPVFPGTGGHLLLATLMATGLYMEVPGTWQQALFSTCFALTLTTIALPQTLATGLRLLYVLIAILLVLVVNRFFFPTSVKSQFRYNLQELFHMHQVTLRLLSGSLTAPLDYGVICDTQIRYHLIHDQILTYIKEKDREEQRFIRELLRISWHMISEAELMMFLINNRQTNRLDTGQMEDYLMFTAHILYDIQKMLNMKTEQSPQNAATLHYKRRMEGESRLSELMNQYSKQVSAMYRCVCRHIGKEERQ